MKNILTTILLGFLFSANCDGQSVIKDSVVDFKLPRWFHKLGSEKLAEKKSTYGYLGIDPIFKYTFKTGNIIIGINDTKLVEAVDSGHLREMKISFDNRYKQFKFSTYRSQIKTFDNNKFLIYRYETEGNNYYWFLGFNKDHLKSFSGVVLYLKPDSVQAGDILNQILCQVKFKRDTK